jgi:MRG-binding protein
VGGDSDSSALTQESGDEAAVGTPRESVATGTDAGTEFGEDEDVEMKEPSPG